MLNAALKEINELKAQVNLANKILEHNLEWVRCGIGGNCSGYPKDHEDYIVHKNYLEQSPAQCLKQHNIELLKQLRQEWADGKDIDFYDFYNAYIVNLELDK